MKQHLLYILLWIQAISALPLTAQPQLEHGLSTPANVESTMVVAPRMRARAERQATIQRIDNFVKAYNERRQTLERRQQHAKHTQDASDANAPAYVPQASAVVAGEARAPPPGPSLPEMTAEIGTDIGRQMGTIIGTAIAGPTLGGRVGPTVGAPIGTRIGEAVGAAIDKFLQDQGIP